MEVESAALRNGDGNGGGELANKPPGPDQTRRCCTCRNICIAAALNTVIIVLVLVILSFTVLKARRPTTAINSISLEGLNFSIDVLRLAVNINLMMGVGVSVRNPNKFGASYGNTTAVLNYRDVAVGEAPVPAGRISADQTKPMNVTMTLLADRFLSDPKAIGDVMSGSLPLNTYMKLSGKVKIIVFKVHFHSTTSCNFTVFLYNRSVSHQQCTFSTKL